MAHDPLLLARRQPLATPYPDGADADLVWRSQEAAPRGRLPAAERAADFPLGWGLDLFAQSQGLADRAALDLSPSRPQILFSDPTPRWPRRLSVLQGPRAVALDFLPGFVSLLAPFFGGQYAAADALFQAFWPQAQAAGVLAAACGICTPGSDDNIDFLGGWAPWFATRQVTDGVPGYGRYWDPPSNGLPNRTLLSPAGDSEGWHFGETLHLCYLSVRGTADSDVPGGQASAHFFPYGWADVFLPAAGGEEVTFHGRPLKFAADLAWQLQASKKYRRAAWRAFASPSFDLDEPAVQAFMAEARAAGLDAAFTVQDDASAPLPWAAGRYIAAVREFFNF